jgi:hypothetical protein
MSVFARGSSLRLDFDTCENGGNPSVFDQVNLRRWIVTELKDTARDCAAKSQQQGLHLVRLTWDCVCHREPSWSAGLDTP